jgi:hypothetical protein
MISLLNTHQLPLSASIAGVLVSFWNKRETAAEHWLAGIISKFGQYPVSVQNLVLTLIWFGTQHHVCWWLIAVAAHGKRVAVLDFVDPSPRGLQTDCVYFFYLFY